MTNWLLPALACAAIFPLLPTLYPSVFSERMIVFPPQGCTLDLYSLVAGKFDDAIGTSLRTALTTVALSLLIGVSMPQLDMRMDRIFAFATMLIW